MQLPNGAWQTFDALVDSGADWSVFDLTAAQFFGVQKDQLQREDATVVGGTVRTWKGSPLLLARLRPLNNEFFLRPVFIQTQRWHPWRRKRPPLQETLVGRADFMRAWEVTFSEDEQRAWFKWRGDGVEPREHG